MSKTVQDSCEDGKVGGEPVLESVLSSEQLLPFIFTEVRG